MGSRDQSATNEIERKIAARDLRGAEREASALLKSAPDNPDFLFLSGLVNLELGRFRRAAQHIDKAIENQLSSAQGAPARWLLALGGAHRGLRDTNGALKAFGAALELDPECSEAHYWRAEIFWVNGQMDLAVENLEAVIRISPENTRAAVNLAEALKLTGRFAESLDVLEDAVERQPDNPALLHSFAVALRDADLPAAAAEAARKSLAADAQHLEGHVLLVSLLIALGRLDDADRAVTAGLSLHPDSSALLSYRAVIRLSRGEKAAALSVLRDALAKDPSCVPAISYFAMAGGDMDDPRQVEVIEELLAAGSRPPYEISALHFAAGQRLGRLGKPDDAFRHFDLANVAKRELLEQFGQGYDPACSEDALGKLVENFGPAAFRAPRGSDSNIPVFIVGMPRSGTSLVEQIVASHPEGHGAGEVRFFNDAAARLTLQAGYPEKPLPEKLLKALAEDYLAQVGAGADGATRITDKMPANFMNLGLIAHMFPNARVIHVRRDPMDTCLSCYFHSFAGSSNPYIYSIDWLAHYYGIYLKAMDHWRSALPLRMLELDYETLVDDQENQSRRLIEFLGLEWDEACLAFHKTARPVLTASHSQVRQPMYRSSIGAWRQYEQHLEPLKAGLKYVQGPKPDSHKRSVPRKIDMPERKLSAKQPPTFADILHPMTPEEFFGEYYGQKLAHIRGGADKFANAMSWASLTDILNMSAAWSSRSLQLVMDKDVVRPAAFCESATNRDGQEVLRPNAEKVMTLLQRGASLVANDIDTLTPGLREVAAALEEAVYGKAQANLYCSWKEHQAFGSHFDTHDVYAMHIAGEKLWRIYETRADTPIAHPDFKSYGQEWHDKNRGAVAQEILMRPGDLLYIPRGLYHDALATSDGTIHIAFGVTHVIGLDALDLFKSLAVSESLFRENMPHPAEGANSAANWLVSLGERLAEFGRSPEAQEAVRKFQGEFRFARGGFQLPVTPPGRRYKVTGNSLNVEEREGFWVLASKKGAAPIPPGLDRPVAWIIERSEFEENELTESFASTGAKEIEKLLADLAAMKVVKAIG